MVEDVGLCVAVLGIYNRDAGTFLVDYDARHSMQVRFMLCERTHPRGKEDLSVHLCETNCSSQHVELGWCAATCHGGTNLKLGQNTVNRYPVPQNFRLYLLSVTLN